MFDIFIDSHFAAGHHLRGYPGNCEKPHGHNWKIRATIRVQDLDELGMAIDFRTVKKAVDKVMDTLDHIDLNEHPEFQNKNPSSENIAVHIFRELEKTLSTDRYRPYSIEVRETDNAGVIYRGG